MTRSRAAVLAAGCLLLAACATRGPLHDPSAVAVELDATPFFPQLEHQCGPAALATVLGASGIDVAPESLATLVYLPGRRGSLQIEMQAAPRRFGRIAYPLAPELDAILAELRAGRPVLVLHNYGLPSWPRWHYAVVVGFDPAARQVMLRSGATRRQVLSTRNFMRAWDNGGRWALVLLRPGELPVRPDGARYRQAAVAFEAVAAPQAAGDAWQAAIGAWPLDPVPWVGRGTARYRAGDLQGAATDYRHALGLDPGLAAAHNNLAMVLLEQGCPAAARRQLRHLDAVALQGALRDVVSDTMAKLEARGGIADAAHCPPG